MFPTEVKRVKSPQLDCWQLLFDLALSHGRPVTEQLLTRKQLDVFLKCIGIFGAATGVSPTFLDTIWASTMHPEPSPDADSFPDERAPCLESDSSIVGPPHSSGRAGLPQFVTMMNAICIRCAQCAGVGEEGSNAGDTPPTAELAGGDAVVRGNDPGVDGSDVADGEEAVGISTASSGQSRKASPAARSVFSLSDAADTSLLRESVEYVAEVYFRSYIHRNIVKKHTVIMLDSTKNSWTPQVNQLIVHVVGSMLHSVVIPLFTRFSSDGVMTLPQYDRFVSAVFRDLQPPTRAAAMAVFHFDKFERTRDLLTKHLRHKVQPFPLSLELDTFVDALLMLGVVAFADERVYPHHRSIASKLWSVFEEFYVPYMGEWMACSPSIDGEYSSIPPVVSLVYPSELIVDDYDSFLVGGLNLCVCPTAPLAEDSDGAGSPHLQVSEETLAAPRPLLPSLTPHPKEGTALDAAQTTPRRSLIRSLGSGRRQPIRGTRQLASKLFPEEFERVKYSEFNSPIYGFRLCTVFLDNERVQASQLGLNRAQVFLNRSFRDPRSFRPYAVFTGKLDHFQSTAAAENPAATPSTPMAAPPVEGSDVIVAVHRVRTATVSLRDAGGLKEYSRARVVLRIKPVLQTVPAEVVERLRGVYNLNASEGRMGASQFAASLQQLSLLGIAGEDQAEDIFARYATSDGNGPLHTRAPVANTSAPTPVFVGDGAQASYPDTANVVEEPTDEVEPAHDDTEPVTAAPLWHLNFSGFLHSLGEMLLLNHKPEAHPAPLSTPIVPFIPELLHLASTRRFLPPIHNAISTYGRQPVPPHGSYNPTLDAPYHRAMCYRAATVQKAAAALQECQRSIEAMGEHDAPLRIPPTRLWNRSAGAGRGTALLSELGSYKKEPEMFAEQMHMSVETLRDDFLLRSMVVPPYDTPSTVPERRLAGAP